eukprot:scaffold49658_cov30-Tisochrysis_lutea.AAC.3
MVFFGYGYGGARPRDERPCGCVRSARIIQFFYDSSKSLSWSSWQPILYNTGHELTRLYIGWQCSPPPPRFRHHRTEGIDRTRSRLLFNRHPWIGYSGPNPCEGVLASGGRCAGGGSRDGIGTADGGERTMGFGRENECDGEGMAELAVGGAAASLFGCFEAGAGRTCP